MNKFWQRIILLKHFRSQHSQEPDVYEIIQEQQMNENLIKTKQGKNLRLIVYSYLSVNQNLVIISRLSHTERNILVSIKQYQVQLNKQQCLKVEINQETLNNLILKEQIDYALKLSSKINLLYTKVDFQNIEKPFDQTLNNLVLIQNEVYIYFEFYDCSNMGKKFSEFQDLYNKNLIKIFGLEIDKTTFSGKFCEIQQLFIIDMMDEKQFIDFSCNVYKHLQSEKTLTLAQKEYFQKFKSKNSSTKSIKLVRFQIVDPIFLFKMLQLEDLYLYDCVINNLCYLPLQEMQNIKILEFIQVNPTQMVQVPVPEYLTYDFPLEVLKNYTNLTQLTISANNFKDIFRIKDEISYLKQPIDLSIIVTKPIFYEQIIKDLNFSDNLSVDLICPQLDMSYRDYQKLDNPDNKIQFFSSFIIIKQTFFKNKTKKSNKEFTLIKIKAGLKKQMEIKEQLLSTNQDEVFKFQIKKSKFKVRIKKYDNIQLQISQMFD